MAELIKKGKQFKFYSVSYRISGGLSTQNFASIIGTRNSCWTNFKYVSRKIGNRETKYFTSFALKQNFASKRKSEVKCRFKLKSLVVWFNLFASIWFDLPPSIHCKFCFWFYISVSFLSLDHVSQQYLKFRSLCSNFVAKSKPYTKIFKPFFQGPEYRIEKYTRTGRKSFYTLPVREVFGHMLPDTAVPGSNQASRLCSNKKPADRQRIV